MYKDYFHFTEMPFSIAPDPRFLYMSSRHREALAHLLFGMQGEGGIVLLTGEVGTGKTTLCRCLLEQIDARCDVAFILNPKMSAEELLAAICDEFHIEVPVATASVKVLVDAINAHLLCANAEGRRAVLIIDEAQNLRPDVLEQLRLLTNLETNTRKLLQIILIGQPELQDMLHRPELRQVAQRIVARYHLTHLTRLEVAAYVVHRLRIAGAQLPLIPFALIGSLYRLTGGVPRLINLVCDRALLGTYVQGKMQVTPKILRKAAGEVFGMSARRRWHRFGWQLVFLAALCGGGVLGAGYVSVLKQPLASPSTQAPAPANVPPTRLAMPSSLDASTATVSAASTDQPSTEGLRRPGGTALPFWLEAATVSTDQPPTEDLRWPDGTAPRTRSEDVAFQDLFKLYGVAYEPGGKRAACKAAEAVNMYCLFGRGGLSDLLHLNQPAVLVIDGGGKGERYHAVLTALSAKSANFIVAGTPRSVSLAAIAPLWSGSYAILWHAPLGKNRLAEGSRGPAVLWLRHGLARLQGGDAEGPALFDHELVRGVKAFQLAEGIVPDGVAGALTLIRLNLRLDNSLPRLTSAAVGG